MKNSIFKRLRMTKKKKKKKVRASVILKQSKLAMQNSRNLGKKINV